MELNLDSKAYELKVTYGGKVYDVRPLKVKEQVELQKATKGLEQDSEEYVEKTLQWIAKCGFPYEQLLDLNGAQLEELVSVLSKKK